MKNESQLDISTPILSVRRHLDPCLWSATKKSPLGTQFSPLLDRLEKESEVSKPAAVPFQWERIPGRPKRDSLSRSDEEPAITPRTPPGRLFGSCSPRPPRAMMHNAQNLSGEAFRPSRLIIPGTQFSEMFSPRLCPGRLDSLKHTGGEVHTPKLTPRRLSDVLNISGRKSWVKNNIKCQGEALTTNDHASLLEGLKDSSDADGETDEDKGHDAFSDTFNSLSTDESLSFKSTVSDWSSSYYQNCGSSGNFSVDLQTRAFMMSRFLPAAEAAVAHTPRQVPKRPTMVIGKTVNKVIPSERKSLLKQPSLNVRPSINQLMEYLEIDDEEVEYDDPTIRTGKTFGIFHRLCGNNVVFRSDKKSRMKLKTRPSQPSSDEISKLTRNAYSRAESNPLIKRYKPTQSSSK